MGESALRWTSAAVSLAGDAPVSAAIDGLAADLGGEPPDLCFVFCAGLDAERETAVVQEIRRLLRPRVLSGCGASGVIGAGRELEGLQSVAVLAGRLGQTQLRSFRLDPGEAPETLTERSLARRRLHAALLDLPEEQRDVFLLHEEAGLNLDQIAAVTDANRETVKSRLRYAVKKLRAAIDEPVETR